MTAVWTPPRTWHVDDLVSADDLNEELSNNLDFLKATFEGLIILQDQKSANTNGGTFTSGSWQTRTLNTEVADAGEHCSLASNQFTLDAGTYEILAFSPAVLVGDHQTRLQNVTDNTTVLSGSSTHASPGSNGANYSHIMGRFTIASSKSLEIQHYCTSTRATDGFGMALGQITEVYASVWLRKVA